MATQPKWLRQIHERSLESLFSLPVIAVLHRYGLVGHAPLWVLATLLVTSFVVQQREIQQLLVGAGRPRDLHRVVAVQYVLIGMISYTTGWGPLLPIAFAITAMMYMRSYGSRTWRTLMLWSLIVIVGGQTAIAVGWVYCYLSPTLAQVAGFLGAQTALFFIRALGQSVEDREHAEAEVRRSEERFRALVQDSTDAVSVMERTGHLSYVSPPIKHITGLTPEQFMAAHYSRWLHPDDHATAARSTALALADPGGEYRFELRLWHANGELRWVEVTLRNLFGNPAVDGLVSTYRDVTERRATQERLIYDANHDPLTGLANRAAFLRGLEQSFADAELGTRTPAVLFVDLDGFKQVNDVHGHQCGDALIIAVAEMLRRSVPGSDIVGRLGGDEFGVVLTSVASAEYAVEVAKRILAEMDLPVLIEGQEFHARASIGVAIAESDNADELLHHADLAMYAAKRRQSHSYHLYVEGLPDPSVDAAALDERHHAVSSGNG